MSRMPGAALSLSVCVFFVVALGTAIWSIAGHQSETGLADLLGANLENSGVGHPVTAVLLNFRGYDTLLEIGVLVIAGIAGISMTKTTALEEPGLRTADPLLYALQRWLVPLMLMLSGYLLWAGTDRPGGAFQAGAVLAATGVLMRLGGVPLGFLRPGILLRAGLVLGFGVFLVVALASAVAGKAFLAYPPALSGALIVTIEIALTLSIAMVLLALFVAAPINDAVEPEEGDPS
jgi:multisubunit Na+/H+ antiporter MnhB subunit